MVHRGQLVEKIVRKSGYSLTKLAGKLGVSRNTLYNRFANANLTYQFIIEVGKVIYYDFTVDFPEMKEELKGDRAIEPNGEDKAAALWRVEGKYAQLLEKYNKLLELVIRVVDKSGSADLHQEINQIIEKETTHNSQT